MSTRSNGSTDTVGSLSGGPQPMAGLSGVQSGMGLSSLSIPDSSSTYQFTMPTSSGPNTQQLQNVLATGAGDLAVQQNSQVPHQTGSGRVSTHAISFTPGLLDALAASGTNSGNSLIQMLQKYKVGAQ